MHKTLKMHEIKIIIHYSFVMLILYCKDIKKIPN